MGGEIRDSRPHVIVNTSHTIARQGGRCMNLGGPDLIYWFFFILQLLEEQFWYHLPVCALWWLRMVYLPQKWALQGTRYVWMYSRDLDQNNKQWNILSPIDIIIGILIFDSTGSQLAILNVMVSLNHLLTIN